MQNRPHWYELLGLAVLVTAACGEGDSESASDASETVVADATQVDGETDARGESRFLISWTLEGGCSRGEEIETTVRGLFDGRSFVDQFSCDTGSGLTSVLSPGDFEVQLRLLDTDDIIIPPDSGPVASALVAISGVSGPHTSVEGMTVPVAVAFPTSTAGMILSWDFTEKSLPLTCADAGVASLDIAYEREEGIERDVQVSCSAGMDESGPLPLGLYSVRVTPRSAEGAVVYAPRTQTVGHFVGNDTTSISVGFTDAS